MIVTVFFESSVWIDHLRGAVTPGTRALCSTLDPDTGEDDPAEILVGDLVLLEVLRGIADGRSSARAIPGLLAYRTPRSVHVAMYPPSTL